MRSRTRVQVRGAAASRAARQVPAALAERVPPHNADAEASVLGAVLLRNDSLKRIASLAPEDFYDPRHHEVFGAIKALEARGIPIDPVTLEEELTGAGKLPAVGGLSFLSELLDAVPTADNVEHYAEIVADKATARRLIGVASEVAAKGFGEYGEVRDYLDDAERLIFEVTRRRKARLPAAAPALADEWARSLPPPVPTGISALDRALDGGLAAESVALMNGAAGHGKTALAVQLARSASAARAVLYVSAELSARQIAARLAGQEARLPWASIFRAGPERREEVAGYLARLKRVHVTERCDLDAIRDQVHAIADRWGSPPLLIVDYLQHVARRLGAQDLRYAVSTVCDALQRLALEERSTVFALSSTSRASQQRRQDGARDAEGWMNAGKESGDLEYDAAVVMGLELDPPEAGADGRAALIQIAKNRFGAQGGEARLWFVGALGFFVDARPSQLSAAERAIVEAILAGAQKQEDIGKHASTAKRNVGPLLRDLQARGAIRKLATGDWHVIPAAERTPILVPGREPATERETRFFGSREPGFSGSESGTAGTAPSETASGTDGNQQNRPLELRSGSTPVGVDRNQGGSDGSGNGHGKAAKGEVVVP